MSGRYLDPSELPESFYRRNPDYQGEDVIDSTTPSSPDPLTALPIALDRLEAYINGAPGNSDDPDFDFTTEDREFIREARYALAALPSAPDHRLREALTGPGFVGQMNWPCTCEHPKSDHYFGDGLDSHGQSHTSCQRGDGCHRFTPAELSPDGSLRHDARKRWHEEPGSAWACVPLTSIPVLSEASSDPALDVERRLYVLAKLVGIAHDEMPERLNNRTRVNVNHAAAAADPLRGHSCGECNELLAEYDRLAPTCVYCSGPDRAGPCFGGDKCMRLFALDPATTEPKEPE